MGCNDGNPITTTKLMLAVICGTATVHDHRLISRSRTFVVQWHSKLIVRFVKKTHKFGRLMKYFTENTSSFRTTQNSHRMAVILDFKIAASEVVNIFGSMSARDLILVFWSTNLRVSSWMIPYKILLDVCQHMSTQLTFFVDVSFQNSEAIVRGLPQLSKKQNNVNNLRSNLGLYELFSMHSD